MKSTQVFSLGASQLCIKSQICQNFDPTGHQSWKIANLLFIIHKKTKNFLQQCGVKKNSSKITGNLPTLTRCGQTLYDLIKCVSGACLYMWPLQCDRIWVLLYLPNPLPGELNLDNTPSDYNIIKFYGGIFVKPDGFQMGVLSF